MREYREFTSLMDKFGDKIFTTVLEVTHSRELTVEAMAACAEEYLDVTKKLKTRPEQYKCYLGLCGKKLGREFFITKRQECLSEYERGKILKSAELYYKTGGRSRRHKSYLLMTLAVLMILGGLFWYEWQFVTEGGYERGMSEWGEFQEEREENYPDEESEGWDCGDEYNKLYLSAGSPS